MPWPCLDRDAKCFMTTYQEVWTKLGYGHSQRYTWHGYRGCHWRPQCGMGQLQVVQQVPTQTSTRQCHWHGDGTIPLGSKQNPGCAYFHFSQLHKQQWKWRQRQWYDEPPSLLSRSGNLPVAMKTKTKLQKLHALTTKLCTTWRSYLKLPTMQCLEEFFVQAHTGLHAQAVDLVETWQKPKYPRICRFGCWFSRHERRHFGNWSEIQGTKEFSERMELFWSHSKKLWQEAITKKYIDMNGHKIWVRREKSQIPKNRRCVKC